MIKDSKIKVIYRARSSCDLIRYDRIDPYDEDNRLLPPDYSPQ